MNAVVGVVGTAGSRLASRSRGTPLTLQNFQGSAHLLDAVFHHGVIGIGVEPGGTQNSEIQCLVRIHDAGLAGHLVEFGSKLPMHDRERLTLLLSAQSGSPRLQPTQVRIELLIPNIDVGSGCRGSSSGGASSSDTSSGFSRHQASRADTSE